MRIFLAVTAVVGVLLAALGILTSTGWIILVGAAALVVALVMGALAAPSTRRHR